MRVLISLSSIDAVEAHRLVALSTEDHRLFAHAVEADQLVTLSTEDHRLFFDAVHAHPRVAFMHMQLFMHILT